MHPLLLNVRQKGKVSNLDVNDLFERKYDIQFFGGPWKGKRKVLSRLPPCILDGIPYRYRIFGFKLKMGIKVYLYEYMGREKMRYEKVR